MYIKDMFDMRELTAQSLINTLNGTLTIPYGISRNDIFALQVDSLHQNIVIIDSPVSAQRINSMYSFMRTLAELQRTKTIMASLVDCDSTGDGLIYADMANVNPNIMKGNYQNGAANNLAIICETITDRRNTCYDVDCHDYQSYNRYAAANGLDEIPPMIIFLDNLDAVFNKEELGAESTVVRQHLQTIFKYAKTMGIVLIAGIVKGYTADMDFIERAQTLYIQPETSGNLARVSNASLGWESEIVRLPNA